MPTGNSGSMSDGLTIKLSFAASGTASGLIGNGLSYFLLLYYSQVLGLDPALAGLAMMLSLIVDAVSDPLIGRGSDRLNTALVGGIPSCLRLLYRLRLPTT